MNINVTFEEWINNRNLPYWGTNFGTEAIAFQRWRHFKEAYAPEIVKRALSESEIPVKNCLDPFGGSGTTALACQFLGVVPTTIEVNPYLSDLIKAKLEFYDFSTLSKDLGAVIKRSYSITINIDIIRESLPPTFIEPGVKGRWIFDIECAIRIFKILAAINELDNSKNKNLFKVLLGGILIDISNVKIDGKGRKYKNNWINNRVDPVKVDKIFQVSVTNAISDITMYQQRKSLDYKLLTGDSRKLINETSDIDLCIFSPPYPNSFDYTDVYNVELWVLGYLKNAFDSSKLRKNTLSSHVQTKRVYSLPPKASKSLDLTMKELENVRNNLWNKDIPSMVGAYFHELISMIETIKYKMSTNSKLWMIVGDSKYQGIYVPVATILVELAIGLGFSVDTVEAFRSMRSSVQQGGRKDLKETLIVLKN
ncbi:hypothetical protein LQL31_004559 [Salmonella enterica subsp. enterica serovar Newport]|nr:site-specific DNA-methyltransferase [Salmonella enterica]EIN2214815.1 hypothetical protein [Salmonella enterica subsp. enterica serovar Newport]EDZ4407792.1 site-specific DNA-methyltransferase [Salmonella enterica]EIO4230196.1 hypothetical protein [Salmonella enterica subsp. enterica serovar Newport]EIO4273036.1 hypothetical protein [Salmonella enterica subsp. enterica serovar Newport]